MTVLLGPFVSVSTILGGKRSFFIKNAKKILKSILIFDENVPGLQKTSQGTGGVLGY